MLKKIVMLYYGCYDDNASLNKVEQALSRTIMECNYLFVER